MARITFDQLIPIYRNTAFEPVGDGGRLRVADTAILETLKLIHIDDVAFEDAAIKLIGAADKMEVGDTIDVEVSAPRLGLGQLSRDVDGLIAAPANRIKEAPRYYVIGDRYAYNDSAIPESITRYRNALRFVKALSEAAAFVDPHQAEATFLGPGRLRIPIAYKIADLGSLTSGLLDELEAFVFDKIHKDQKMAILASNVIELCRQQPEGDRFKYLAAHARELVAKTQEGYKLFASEFSYEKIKGKTEEAISEYANKIHKTFHDIQNQVMGVPVATVIVAFQMKDATTCGVAFWGNLAVSVGATLFVFLLTMAVWNQLMTLSSISADLTRQKDKLSKDYAAVSAQFVPLYDRLARRVCIHRLILFAILIVCWAGVYMTWYIYGRVTVPEFSACLR